MQAVIHQFWPRLAVVRASSAILALLTMCASVSADDANGGWASPRELRAKKMIGAGQYSAINIADPETPTPEYLAANPDYLANHPFDGIVIPVRLDQKWCKEQGLISEPAYELHSLVMTRLPLDSASIGQAVNDLKRVKWGHLTDNFLWYGVRDGTMGGDNDVRMPIHPDSPEDWDVVTRNAALCARVCRETGLKGFVFDTEMYSDYQSGEHYPFGKGSPEVWRERGRTWIRAVQAEFPQIKILLFFSWGPEHEPGGWPGYGNLKHFMNGILAGIRPPGRLIHAWESAFWFGGRRIMPDGKPYVYPGDRAAYAKVRDDIRNVWRNLSDNPAKYDRFVDAGSAAWVESDPWNLYPGMPSGYLTQLPWANLPYALAYSDEYVWVWCEHTHYPRTKGALNPFLASLANQTLNTGREPVGDFSEDFSIDPVRKGWYFDFDMLGIGREVNPGYMPAMNTDSVAYSWSPESRSLHVRGAWMTGLRGEAVGKFDGQRRRYVRPIKPLGRSSSFHVEMDFTVDSFGSDASNPMLLGLFNSGQIVAQQSLMLQIYSRDSVRVVLTGDKDPWFTRGLWLRVKGGLKTGRRYTVAFDYTPRSGPYAYDSLAASLTDVSASAKLASVQESVPDSAGRFEFDEIGAALWDSSEIETPEDKDYSYRLERVVLKRRPLTPRAAIQLVSPREYQVFQRDTAQSGSVTVKGCLNGRVARLQARMLGRPRRGVLDSRWRNLPFDRASGTFSVPLPAKAGGWYRLEVRAWCGGSVRATAVVNRLGIGEVFAVAGQSNSTNCGEAPMSQTSGMGVTFSGNDWRLADDPQPGVHDGSGSGSPWPAFLDAMHKKYRVPVAIACTGHGGTRAADWTPDTNLYDWLMARIRALGPKGFRAVLWHQGESDVGTTSDESYYDTMSRIITTSKRDAGGTFPWFVAEVGMTNAQRRLWDSKVALPGPNTDVLSGPAYRFEGGAHFTKLGLKRHGEMWAESVGIYLDSILGLAYSK